MQDEISEAGNTGALDGVRVLDLTHYITGPYCTKLFADYGAEVIKIERPDGGDPARNMGPFLHDEPGLDRSGLFLHLNTNKKSVTLNLKSHAGRKILLDLARDADIVVESFSPDVMPSLGLDYAAFEAVNPSIVMTSISNFGRTGPYRDYEMSEITAYALGGTMHSTGLAGRPPLKLGLTVEQFFAGMVSATATMGAFMGAQVNGEGQHVDLSIMEMMVGNQDRAVQTHMLYQYNGTGMGGRSGGGSPGRSISPAGVYPTMDGYVQFFALQPHWERVCRMIDRPDLINDPHFTAPENFTGNAEVKAEVDAILLEWLLVRTKREVMEKSQEAGYPCGAINTMEDVFNDPHLADRGFFVQVDHPATGPLRYPGAPFKMSETSWRPGRAPMLGEHTQEVLRGRGYGDEDIATLREQGGGLMARLPLEGIRVVDMCVVWAGPFGSALLGDLGAEVIRVETVQHWDLNNRIPGNPELIRARAPDMDPDATPWNLSPNANSVGRNKLSVTMDLTRPEGLEAFHRLIKVSDIFIENNSPELMERLKLRYEPLSAVNPKLIMISMAAFGSTGPYKHFRAFGANMEAVVGHTLLRGYPDTDATANTGVFLADATGGATSAFALMAALYHRNKTGRGQFIDMSQAENVSHTLSQAVMDYSMNGRVRTTLGNRDASRAPQGVYACTGDDNWIALSCGSDAEFAGLCRAMGRPLLADDPRFADSLSRLRDQDALDEEISAWTLTLEHYEAFHRLQDEGVPSAPVLTPAEVAADPQLWSRDVWQRMKHPAAGTHWYQKSPISRMSKTPLSIRRHASNLGEDNEYVYKDLLGYTDTEYQWFVDNGHAGTTFLNPNPRGARR